MNNEEQNSENATEFYEEKIAHDTLERYSGSNLADFQPFVLLTNFSRYTEYFAKSRNLEIHIGSYFKTVHSPKEKITFLDFNIGSPAAALVVDLCAFLPIKACLLLGMCGGLRRQYKIGDYFVPVASIRGEGTSDFYFPSEVPALANFLMQKIVTNVLDKSGTHYHIGITHTTNKRFWEFNHSFKEKIKTTRPQAIEMECATLFMASYSQKLPLGALLLISDLPLSREGIKTKESAQSVYEKFTVDHVEKGVQVMRELEQALKHQAKGVFRGNRRRFEQKIDING
jgi:AMP nucleosidase